MNTKASLMRFKTRTKETGQALVLIAMLIVILLAALGLAIDGGGMFLLWRDAQNAVDTAAMQAAFAYCTSNENFDTAKDVGLRAALANGFDNVTDNTVTVVQAPPGRIPANATTPNGVMLVTISAKKPAYFIQLVYGGPLEISVDALGVCNPGGDLIYDGYGIFSTASNDVCGWDGATASHAQVGASGATHHYWGAMFTNGNAAATGSGPHFHDGAGYTYVNEVTPASLVSPSTSTSNKLSAPLTSFPILYTYSQFVPGGSVYEAIFAADPTKVHYLTGSMGLGTGPAAQVDFYSPLEGLYVAGGDIDFKGDVEFGPLGATFVSGSGNIDASGSTSSDALWQPYTDNPVTKNLLMFSALNNGGGCGANSGQSAISFSGNKTLGMGILYAPDSTIYFSGSKMAWCGAIISKTFSNSASEWWLFGSRIPAWDKPGTTEDLLGDGAPTEFMPYQNRNCDFIESTDANYSLGD
jgi:hypothetical protein